MPASYRRAEFLSKQARSNYPTHAAANSGLGDRQRFFNPKTTHLAMGVMRKSHITDRYSVILPGSAGDGTPEPEDEPIISLVNRDGVLQRVHGYRSRDGDSWAIHVFESRNPIVSTDTESSYGDNPRYYHPAYGYHYVLTAAQAAPDMAESEQWLNMLVAVQDRMRWLYDQKKVGYVSVFADVNGGQDKRTPHLQIATFPGVPPVIASEAKAAATIQNERGVCAMCQIISEETNGPRQVIQTDGFLAFCPWSPSYPYEFWIAPKKHSTSFLKTSQRDLGDLALMLQTSLGGMERTLGGIPYSLAFHLSPEKKNTRQIHWHIEVYPATKAPASMDRGFGISLSHTSPEEAAKRMGVAGQKVLAAIMGID